MPDLGTLYYDVLLKDKTDEEYEKIKKKLLNMRIELEAKVGIKTDVETAAKTFDRIVKNKSIKIPVEVDTSGVERMMRNLAKEEISASGLRHMRGWSSIIRAQAYEESQKALTKQRDAMTELRKAQAEAAKSADKHANSTKNLNQAMSSSSRMAGELKNQLSNIYSVYTIERFVRGLIEIGGQFEQQKIAIGSILQDSTKAEVIFGKIKSLAVVSPFQFMDLAGYTKQLTAFSIPYEELYDTTKRLADISAGLGVDMGRIILAYGQVRSAAFLRGQEVRQFTEAGIPLVQALADKFSILENRVVSVGEVFDKISRREVSFGMVKDVLWGMTDEGGQFYNMQEKLADSLYGKWSNLKDQWDVMMSDIAQDTNGTLKAGIEGITKLMESWENIESILNSVIWAYGTYKAVILATNTLEAIAIARKYGLIGATKAHTLEILKNAAAQKVLSISTVTAIHKLSSLKNSFLSLGKAGWIGIVLSGLAAIGSYIYKAYQNSTKLKRELDDIASKGSISAQNEIDGYTILVEKLRNAAKGSQEYNNIIDKIQSRYGAYLGNIKAEADAYEYLHGKIADVTEALRAKAIENAREQGVSKITEKYTEEKTDVYKDIISSLQKEFGISKEFASQLSAVIQSDITNGLGNALSNSYDDAIEYIKKKSKELGKDISIPQRVSQIDRYGYETKIGGATNSIYYLNKFFRLVSEEKNILSEYDDTLKAVMGSTTAYGIKIEELEKAYEKEKESTKDTSKQKELYLQLLEAKKKVYEDFGQEKEVRRMEAEISAVSKTREEWVGLAEDYANTVTRINQKDIKTISLLPQEDERENIVKYLKRIAEEYERIKKDIEDLNNVPFPARGESWQESISRAKFEKQQYDSLIKSLGVDINSFGKGNKAGSDSVADMWKKRIELVDKTIQSYNKWKEVEGKDASETRAKESEAYKQLAASGINVDFQNPQKTYEYIKSKLGNTDKQKELSLSIGVKIENYELDRAKEEVQKAVDDIQKYIEDKSKQWDLYKKIFDISGNKSISMSIAFGGDISFKNIVEDLRNQLSVKLREANSNLSITDILSMKEYDVKDLFGEGEVLKLYQSISEESEKMRAESLSNLLDMIKDYRDYAQKIEDIERNLQKDLADIESQRISLGEESTNRLIAQRKKKAKEDTASITFEQFKGSEDWAKSFEDLDRISSATIKRLINNLEKFKNTTGKDLKVDEYKELVNVLKKLRDENESRNPFEALSKGIKEYVEATKNLKKARKELEHIQNGNGVVNGVTEIGHIEMQKTDSGLPYQTKVVDELIPKLKSLEEAEKNVANAEDRQNAASDKMSVGLNEIIGMADLLIETLGDLSSMFDALGNDSMSDTLTMLQEVGGGLIEAGKGAASLIGGISSGNPMAIAQGAAGMISGITGIIGGIARFHDKKLDKSIQRSALEVKKLQNAYNNLQSIIERQLGSVTESQSSQMLENLKKQREEVENQRRAEEEKKDSDSSKIEDYKQQIHELDEQIKYLYDDLAKEQYGIDIKSWADQISDALITAFQNGEDAAQAFDDTVADIMRSVLKNMLSLQIIKPAMESLRDALFGENGLFMPGSEAGTDLSKNEAVELGKELEKMKDTISQSKKVWDYVNGALKGVGVDLEENKDNNSSLIKGVQNITEDQANILASYTNAIRYDTSVMRAELEKLGVDILPQYSVIAEAQLRELRDIAENTRLNVRYVEEIRDIFRSVVHSTSSGKGVKLA